MSDLYFKRVGRGSSKLGLLMSHTDPGRVYLAIPAGHFPEKPIGVFIADEILELQQDEQGNEYAAVRWTQEFDCLWVDLIDLMISVRHAHPTMVQLHLFDPELVPA